MKYESSVGGGMVAVVECECGTSVVLRGCVDGDTGILFKFSDKYIVIISN